MDNTHDVFISYSHADDEIPIGADYGWVTTFVTELKKVLRLKLGGQGASVWMDHNLVANEIVDETLMEMVHASRTLVLFLSPGYLKSTWCNRELGKFLEVNHAKKNKESVFIVELEPTPREKWHPRLRSLTPIQFYVSETLDCEGCRLLGFPVPDPKENSPYWRKLISLAHLLSKYLIALPENRSNDAEMHLVSSISSAQESSLVWIAQPVSQLVNEWEKLAEALRQRGARIVPVGVHAYPLATAAELMGSVQKDLQKAQLLVQLLDEHPGDMPPGGSSSLTAIQAMAAYNQCQIIDGLRYMRWRPPSILIDELKDSPHKDLLLGAMACGFEEFRRLVLEAVDALFKPKSLLTQSPVCSTDSITLCVSCGPKDEELSRQVSAILADLGHSALVTPSTPEKDQTPQEFRLQVEQMLSEVEGVILVYGQETVSWVQAQYARVRKIFSTMGRRSLWGALLDGPPLEKSSVGLSGRDIVVLNCRGGISSQHIGHIIDSLRAGGEHA
jgi:hypothetical protein